MSLSNVNLIDHPVVQTKLTELRDFTTDHRKFRTLLNEIASLMVYEVTRDWPTQPRPIQTPMEKTVGKVGVFEDNVERGCAWEYAYVG